MQADENGDSLNSLSDVPVDHDLGVRLVRISRAYASISENGFSRAHAPTCMGKERHNICARRTHVSDAVPSVYYSGDAF